MTTLPPYPAADGLVRIYPSSSPIGAGLVWVHGGSFARGSLEIPEADWVASVLSERGIPVISVDYRLAGPGHRYPIPSDDVLTAWAWAIAHAGVLEINPEQFALGGASAGGNLAAGATLRMMRSGSIPLPARVVLAYPTLLALQPEPSPELRAALAADPTANRFTPEAIRRMYEDYLGGPVENAPLAATPGRATASDLAGFPPTLMINSEADDLRISGEVFAATLRAAGCDVELITEPGTRHGHLNRPDEPAAQASIDHIARTLSRPRRMI